MNITAKIKEIAEKVRVFFTHDASEDIKLVDRKGSVVTLQIVPENVFLKYIIKRVWRKFDKNNGTTVRFIDNQIKLTFADEMGANCFCEVF